MNKRNQSNSPLNFEKSTRIILICGIVFLLGGFIYILTKPEDDDLYFFLLNENQQMRDYPTNSTIGQPIFFHVVVVNYLGIPKNFAIKVYLSSSQNEIDSSIGVHNQPNTNYLFNRTFSLNDQEKWTSDLLNVSFSSSGQNQIIIVELWHQFQGNWVYLDDFLLTLRISVYSV
jgi:uncharacterized membrane protein